MKTTSILVLASLLLLANVGYAASHAGAPMAKSEMVSSEKEMVMAEGVVRKIDAEGKKVTLRHGEIKNLDMPGMTMVFGVKDAKMISEMKVGDKVKFHVEKEGTNFVVTTIEKTE